MVWQTLWTICRVVMPLLVPLPSCDASRAPWRAAYAATSLSVIRTPMLTMPKSIGSSTKMSAIASSTTDCPDCPRRRPASVALGLEAGIDGLRELERCRPQEAAALPLVLVADRDPEVVGEAGPHVAHGGRPGDRDGAAVQVVLVVLAAVDRERAVGLRVQVVDVDLGDGGQARHPGRAPDHLDRLGVRVGGIPELGDLDRALRRRVAEGAHGEDEEAALQHREEDEQQDGRHQGELDEGLAPAPVPRA